MKLINKFENFNFDYNLIEKCAKKFELHEDVIKTMMASGYDTEEKIAKFINPTVDDLHDAYLLNDMQKAIERIKFAIDNEESILIYGDYDVDGICATTVLMMALLKRTQNVSYFLPDRANLGYGLSEKSIELVIEEYNPDLIITVDCGITNISQVEYALDLGVDVIVTDHHEPGEEIPNCLCVNPKLNNYPFRDLSGAGVAFKLVNALENEVDTSYLDIVAISTVADLMPLVDENRFIVKQGLEILNTNKRKCIDILLKACGFKGVKIDSNTIGFTLAPKINALGRLSNAMQAVILFLTDDEDVMNEITNVLMSENTKRQQITGSLVEHAESIIKRDNLLENKCLLVHSKEFTSGISGLVSANLTSLYNRPAIVFTENGEFLIGSGRSVEGINLFELLNAIKEDLIVKFGGHSGAAGVTIYKDDFEEFSRRVEDYLNKMDFSVFDKAIRYDIDITDKKIDVSYVKGFEVLAPFGVQNEKPIFIQRVNNVHANKLNGKNHIKFKFNNIDFVYFNSTKYLDLFNDNSTKTLVCDITINNFAGVESVNAKINYHLTDIVSDYENDYKSLNQLMFDGNFKESALPENEWLKQLDNCLKNPFSTLIIVENKDSYNYFIKNILPNLKNKQNIFMVEYQNIPRNNLNCLSIFPNIFDGYGRFSNIFFVGIPYSTGFLNKIKNTNIYILDKTFYNNIGKLDLSRECFGKYYILLKKNAQWLNGGVKDIYDYFVSKNEAVEINQLTACYLVFTNLGLLVQNLNETYTIPENKKVDLNNSKVYATLIKIKEKLN